MSDDIYSSILVNIDFYLNNRPQPICSLILTDVTNQIISQMWLQSPLLMDQEARYDLASSLLTAVDIGFGAAEKNKDKSKQILSAGVAAVQFVTQALSEAEKDLGSPVLIPTPIWANTDVYTEPDLDFDGYAAQ